MDNQSVLTPPAGNADSKSGISFPKTEEQRQEFIRNELEPLKKTPEKIADERYKGSWGEYHPGDPRKSDWRVRQANRYLEELYRQRELRPVIRGLWVATLAIVVAVLAMPMKDSLLCVLFTQIGWQVCK